MRVLLHFPLFSPFSLLSSSPSRILSLSISYWFHLEQWSEQQKLNEPKFSSREGVRIVSQNYSTGKRGGYSEIVPEHVPWWWTTMVEVESMAPTDDIEGRRVHMIHTNCTNILKVTLTHTQSQNPELIHEEWWFQRILFWILVFFPSKVGWDSIRESRHLPSPEFGAIRWTQAH